MSTQAHPLTDLGFKPEQAGGHPLSDLGFKPEAQPAQQQTGRDISYGNLTAGYDPGAESLGPLGKFLSSVGGSVMGAPEGAYNMVRHPLDTVKSIGEALQAYGAGGTGSSITPQGALSVLPEALGQGVGNVAAGEITGAAIKGAPDALPSSEGLRTRLQTGLGVGPEFTKDAAKKWQTQQAAADTAYQNKTAQVTDKYQGKVEATRQLNEQNKADFQQRQQLQTEAQGHAKELAEHLPQLADQERAFAKAMYPEIEGSLDKSELVGKLQDAADNHMKGTDKLPTALSRVMKDLGDDVTRSTGPKIGGQFMDLSDPQQMKAFQKMKDQGVFRPDEISRMEGTSPGGADFEKLHGYYSELGRELSKDLPGDERGAVVEGRKVIESEMRKMAESENKLTQFTEAQKNWKQYERTFNKTWNDSQGMASPIAKVLQAKDPVSGQILPERVQQLLGKDVPYKLSQQMLSRYDGAKTDVLQLMKEKMDQAGGLPKTLKEKAEPAAPTMPERKIVPTPDVGSMKADLLKGKAQQLGGFSGRGMFIDTAALLHFLTTGNPIALSIPIGRRLLAAGLKSGAEGSLSHVTPEETRMFKPSEVYSSSKAAPAYKPSEKASTMSAKSRDLGPEFKAGEAEHEIQRNKEILRNPKATEEEKAIAKQRLKEARQ